jgi:hypothetical protein
MSPLPDRVNRFFLIKSRGITSEQKKVAKSEIKGLDRHSTDFCNSDI